MENGCILNSTYSGGCALPNGNEPAPPAVQIPGPETLSSLPDPPATGFYLWPSDQEQSCSRTLLMARNTQWLDQPYTSRYHNKQSWINVGLYVFLLFLICLFFCGVGGHCASQIIMSPLFTIMQSRVLSLFKVIQRGKFSFHEAVCYKSVFRYNAKHSLVLDAPFWIAFNTNYSPFSFILLCHFMQNFVIFCITWKIKITHKRDAWKHLDWLDVIGGSMTDTTLPTEAEYNPD